MWKKKLSMILLASVVALSFTTVTLPDQADAKRSYSSSKKSFSPSSGSTTQTPNNNINRNQSTTSNQQAGTAATQKPGFFGGGLMKGLMIGGLAGMLFGGLFGGMGFLGEMLGMIVNLLAIAALVLIVFRLIAFFKDRKKEKLNEEPKRL
ncbi:hypothetical protein JCM16163A_28000 [Paenibacillus sp. YK5]